MSVRVRFFHDILSSTHFMNCCCKMWGLSDHSWPISEDKSVVTFVDDDSYTHAVIVNAAMPKLKDDVTSDCVLGLAFEPLELLCPADLQFRQFVKTNIFSNLIDGIFCKYAKEHIGEYFVGKRSSLPSDLFKPYYNFMYCDDWQTNMKRPRNKTKMMSLILSNKTFLPGHMYRYILTTLLLRTNFNIDIYGRGSHHFKDPRSKGSFEDSSAPYNDYMYTIAIENTVSDHYITEKILSPISFDCIPIYLGATKVEDYLGQKCCYKLTGNVISDFNTIVAIASDPEAHLLSLKEAQHEIENGKACFPNFIANHFR